jgi:hypothetical protein
MRNPKNGLWVVTFHQEHCYESDAATEWGDDVPYIESIVVDANSDHDARKKAKNAIVAYGKITIVSAFPMTSIFHRA